MYDQVVWGGHQVSHRFGKDAILPEAQVDYPNASPSWIIIAPLAVREMITKGLVV